MKRYLSLRTSILSQFTSIQLPALREEAITHTLAVCDACIILAKHRHLDDELCAVAALLHDIAIFIYNCPHLGHAEKSAKYAKAYLQSTDFSANECQTILKAIQSHSDKEKKGDPISECLKDADILARYLQDLQIPAEANRRHRLIQICKELSIL